jgi:uncharacterized protein
MYGSVLADIYEVCAAVVTITLKKRDSVQSMNEINIHKPPAVIGWGAVIGILGGLIGLGGAEFRLPVLIGLFGFGALEAVILNKAMSLIVVTAALPFRAASVPFERIAERWEVIATLLVGTLIGAWLGADLATKIRTRTLYRVLSVLLVGVAGVLLLGHDMHGAGSGLEGILRSVIGIIAGFGIGIVAAFMGVAGGELLIPTIVLLFGADLKLAGSLSLAVSLPTMIVGFMRYSRDQSFSVIRAQQRFIALMAGGSLIGAFIGGRLLGLIPVSVLLPLLAAILLVSAVKVWHHDMLSE